MLQRNAGEYLKSFLQDPVMPSQKPPSDAQSAEVDLPLDDTEDTDGSKMHFFYMPLSYLRKLIVV